ncbi:post-gpi attachment to proteins factor 2-like [Plakobranchus ocellatus]|uniref:Post-gpi attachment to proteins factor 2-like n=1 Tax=Plakobranchus ocellatus TaxID=259542 RepID=A0AAV4DU59_9GAST|nr:post-gpi attachment to proteins factor 2-like [Plakobranchus ocellatus]
MADAELRIRTVRNGSIESKAKSQGQMRDVIFNLDMWTFAMLCLTLPATALVICFVTGFLFRFEEVNETMCGVKNYIPSISAVTGITPQTYLWRTCIGLQSAPRLAVCFFYYNQYRNKMHQVAPHRLSLFQKLIRVNFWLNFVENSCLILVAFITNRENYPVHEKIFVVFMVTSLCYMLLNNILFKWSREGHSTELELRSYWWKKVMFAVNIVATSGLIFFFIQHRVFCKHGAFSWFSFCEYFIAYGNMAYHFTGYLDFKGLTVVCGDFSSGASSTSNGTAEHIVNNNTGQRTKSH